MILRDPEYVNGIVRDYSKRVNSILEKGHDGKS